MTEWVTGAYVLTVHLGGSDISPGQGAEALRELAYLDVAEAPSAPGCLAFHCLVAAPSRAEAVAYASVRAVTALIAAGVDRPTVLGVDVSVLEGELV